MTTDATPGGGVKEAFMYDPWGKRIANNGAAFGEYSETANNTVRAINMIDRGYTMHEHLDELGYIHMNGRIYDPVLARFPMADPSIPENCVTRWDNRRTVCVRRRRRPRKRVVAQHRRAV